MQSWLQLDTGKKQSLLNWTQDSTELATTGQRIVKSLLLLTGHRIAQSFLLDKSLLQLDTG